MSIWTQITGLVTLKNIAGLNEPMINYIVSENLGKTCVSESTYDCGTFVAPCGSEGSLQYTVYTLPTRFEVIDVAIVIAGVLRDYDNINEIKEWFEKVITSDFRPGLHIRDATLQTVIGSTIHYLSCCYGRDKGRSLYHAEHKLDNCE